MSASIVSQLVTKDLRLMRGTIVSFALVSLVLIAALSFLIGRIPNWIVFNIGFIMLIGPAGTCGIVVLIKSNVFEKEKSTQSFIMSLPLTVKEFTRAKLWLNLPVFGIFWLIVSAAAFYFAFGRGLFPLGAIPFVTMVFLGVFVAYACILSTSLLTQSLGVTVLAITLFELATSAYLWTVAFISPIAEHIWGAVPVWNPTAIAILTAQALVAATVLLATVFVQSRKRDFI